jgi:hypothetical protein
MKRETVRGKEYLDRHAALSGEQQAPRTGRPDCFREKQ